MVQRRDGEPENGTVAHRACPETVMQTFKLPWLSSGFARFKNMNARTNRWLFAPP